MNVENCEENKAIFWKKNEKQLVEKSCKPIEENCAYNEFQAYVQDVWDLSEEDSYKYQRPNLHKRNENVVKCHGKYEMPLINLPLRKSEHISKRESLTACQNHSYSQNTEKLAIQNGFILKNSETEEKKTVKFNEILREPSIDLYELSKLSWSGVPVSVRAIVWRLLSGCIPVNLDKRCSVLNRKRFDYFELVKQYFYGDRDKSCQEVYHQIHIDVPRMNSIANFFHQKLVQEMFERILYIWAIRHPASGYVQGMNDLVTPFFVVFLQEILHHESIENVSLSFLREEQLHNIEADTFWCLTKLLDGLQDNYIFPQLGIQEKVIRLKELIERIDATLHNHLIKHGVDYLQFSFRWMNNLLTRELPLECTIRLWDTYLAEMEEFSTFQVYVYAAFLIHWRRELLRETDFQGLMLLLQNLPTENWGNDEIRLLVAEAFKLKSIFANAPKHLQSNTHTNKFR